MQITYRDASGRDQTIEASALVGINSDGTGGFVGLVGGAAKVSTGAKNIIRQAAGTYSATTVYGYVVEAAPTADDSAMTSIDGAAITAINKEAFTEGQEYNQVLSSITVGTGGELLLYIG